MAGLRSGMWKAAAFSGAVAAIPNANAYAVSMGFDIGIVAKEATLYFTQLGLDQASLERYAELTSADYQQLQAVVVDSLGCRDISVESFTKLLSELSTTSTPLVVSAAAKVCSVVLSPVIRPFIISPVSFGGTYRALKLVLEKMESVALEVIEFAAERATGAEQSDK